MPCGYKCLDAFQWNPPNPQFCSLHKNTPFPCYILKLPLELRFEIFHYLLPDKEIPFGRQRALKCSEYRLDCNWTCIMSLLLINKQISTEVKTLLYGRQPVTVVITDQQIGMYNCFWDRDEWRSDRNVTGYEYLKDWSENLPRFDFSFIKHLSLNVWAYPYRHEASLYGNTSRVRSLWKRQGRFSVPANGLDARQGVTWLYDICDNLRRFVKVFQSRNSNQLVTLDVKFILRSPPSGSMEAWKQTMVAAVNFLLEPTESFRHVISARVKFEPEPDAYILDHVLQHEEFARPKERWEQLVKSSRQLQHEPLIFDDYSRLEEFTEILIDKKIASGDRTEQKNLDRMLHDARVAKELQNLDRFAFAKNEIMEIWDKYVLEQTLFITEMTHKVSELGGYGSKDEQYANCHSLNNSNATTLAQATLSPSELSVKWF